MWLWILSWKRQASQNECRVEKLVCQCAVLGCMDLIVFLLTKQYYICFACSSISAWVCAAVLTYLAQTGQLDGRCRVLPMTLPDRFIEHGSQADQLAEAGISAVDIARTALSLSGKSREAVLLEKFWYPFPVSSHICTDTGKVKAGGDKLFCCTSQGGDVWEASLLLSCKGGRPLLC